MIFDSDYDYTLDFFIKPLKENVIVHIPYPIDMNEPIVGEFEDVCIINGCFYPYPTNDGQEMIILTDNRFIHCIAVEEYEDTCSGQELMINIYPIDENDKTLILIENCYKVAFITYK